MNIDFPFHFDHRGRTAATADDDFVQDLIEELLFTDPGERVNRPTFGVPLRRRVWEPNDDLEAAAIDQAIRAGLHEWLSDYVLLEKLEVVAKEATLTVTLSYYNLLTGDPRTQTAEFIQSN